MNKNLSKLTIIIVLLLLSFQFKGVAQTEKEPYHLNLAQVLEIAMSESPTVKIAERGVLMKQYYKKEQIVGLFPNISFAAGYNRTLKKQKMVMDFNGMSMEIEVGSSNSYNAGLNMQLPLVMPALWENLKLTQLDVELSLEKARASKLDLKNQIEKTFYTYLMLKESYDFLQKNYQNSEKNNKLINDKFDQGLVSEFEKMRSDVQLANQKPNLLSTKNGLELTEKLLKVLMGVDVNEPIIFDGELGAYEEAMLSKNSPAIADLSLNNNSDLKQLELGMDQLKQAKSLIVASTLPSLAMTGLYQYASLSNDFNFAEYNWFPYSMIGFSLQIPIVSWASTGYKLKQNNLSQQNLQDSRQTLEYSIWVSIYQAIDKMDLAKENYISTSETLKIAQKAYEIAQKQYDVGLATWLDLTNAEFALTSTQLQYLQSIHDYLSAQSDLNKIIGIN